MRGYEKITYADVVKGDTILTLYNGEFVVTEVKAMPSRIRRKSFFWWRRKPIGTAGHEVRINGISFLTARDAFCWRKTP